MKATLVVCESPWMTDGRFEPWSMRPFVEGLRRAFRGFNAEWYVGDDRHEKEVVLANALRVVARDRRQGAKPRLITDDLCRTLKWTTSQL